MRAMVTLYKMRSSDVVSRIHSFCRLRCLMGNIKPGFSRDHTVIKDSDDNAIHEKKNGASNVIMKTSQASAEMMTFLFRETFSLAALSAALPRAPEQGNRREGTF